MTIHIFILSEFPEEMIHQFSILRIIPSICNQMEYIFGKFRTLVIGRWNISGSSERAKKEPIRPYPRRKEGKRISASGAQRRAGRKRESAGRERAYTRG
ncbi:hypothetical protein C7123_09060 [Tannerella serpentiformis]|nr:hypothetical protein BCB71_01665 [Tannerella serpentiformis]AVV53839.1 hypothetical protein C7123_09060 [Tannerella serpentiformis]